MSTYEMFESYYILSLSKDFSAFWIPCLFFFLSITDDWILYIIELFNVIKDNTFDSICIQTQFRNIASYQQRKKVQVLILLQVYTPIIRIFHFNIYFSQKPEMAPQKPKGIHSIGV